MLRKTLYMAGAALLLACGSATAAPVTVDLRVEGATQTIFEGAVTTGARTIDKGDGPHACDGTNLGANPGPGPTMTSALDAAATGAFDWAGTWSSGFEDFVIDRIGPDGADPVAGSFWGYALDFAESQVGGCQQQVRAGQQVLFAYGLFGKPLLHLSREGSAGPVSVGEPLTVRVVDGVGGNMGLGPPVGGAAIAGAPAGTATGADGRVTLAFAEPGVQQLKAELAGAVRSNSLSVCVRGPGVECALGTGGPPLARDARAPTARIAGPRNGRRYRRGPRLLRGTVSDDRGVTQVKIALRRHVPGRHCRWWSGRRERFVGTSCRKVFFFAVGDDPDWSYLLPRRLGAGRYVLDVKAFDAARNRDERFVRGRNRVVFDVAPSGSAAARGGTAAAHRRTGGRALTAGQRPRGAEEHAGPARRRARGARVRVMVVGSAGALAGPATVRARAMSVRASGHACRVGASTPLAALAATLRDRAAPGVRGGLRVRDFGRCSAGSPASSGQLFVDRVGRDRNRGTDGWVYKVGNRVGTAGAADPAGPFGAGRLRSGATVLWFYCVQDVAAAGCQRTLRVIPVRRSVTAGAPLAVRVVGHDDRGRSRAVAGARVRLGGAVALTGADGRAEVRPAAAGRQVLTAEKPGLVRSLPVAVTVR